MLQRPRQDSQADRPDEPEQAFTPIEETFAYRIYRTSRLIRHLHHLTFTSEGLDLTPEQWFILNKLAAESPQSQTSLGENVIDDRPNMTRLLTAMEGKGLLARRTDVSDKRKTEVHLSDLGRAVLEQGLPHAQEVRDSLRDRITTEELDAFWRVLDQFDSNAEVLIREFASRKRL